MWYVYIEGQFGQGLEMPSCEAAEEYCRNNPGYVIAWKCF